MQNNVETSNGDAHKGSKAFVKGAAILGAAGVIVQILGAVFRIPLANMITDTGMGYFQTAFPIYNFILVIATAGIPTSIAKIISEKLAVGDVEGADRVFSVTLKMMAVIGAAMALAVFIGAKPLTDYLNSQKAVMSIIAIAPATFFVSVMAVYRGYFQGRQMMQSYAASQILEQFIRVGLGLALAYVLLSKGVEYSAAGATFGASAGSLAGLIGIMFMYRKHIKSKTDNAGAFGSHHRESASSIMKNIVSIAIPVTIGASVIPVMNLFDLAVAFRRLQDIGIDPETANRMYGQLTGYAQAFINLPLVIVAAISISIVPAIAHLVKVRDKVGEEHTIETGLRLSLIIGLPSAVGLSILSSDIMRLLYPRQLEIAKSTGDILSILAFGLIFLSMFQVTMGILQGIGKQNIPARNLLIGVVFKLVLSYVLVGIPSLNINGAALATTMAFVVSAALNHLSLVKYSGIKIDYKKVFVKPIIDVIAMGVAVKISHLAFAMVVSNSVATASSILVGACVFVVMLFATKTLTDEDLQLMPGGSKLKKFKSIFSR